MIPIWSLGLLEITATLPPTFYSQNRARSYKTLLLSTHISWVISKCASRLEASKMEFFRRKSILTLLDRVHCSRSGCSFWSNCFFLYWETTSNIYRTCDYKVVVEASSGNINVSTIIWLLDNIHNLCWSRLKIQLEGVMTISYDRTSWKNCPEESSRTTLSRVMDEEYHRMDLLQICLCALKRNRPNNVIQDRRILDFTDSGFRFVT